MDKNWCYWLLAAVLLTWSEAAVAKEPDVGQVSSDTTAEVKFLNPIFYETLHHVEYPYPIESSWGVKLTPSKISYENEKIIDEDCQLIENKWMSITLKCDVQYKKAKSKDTKPVEYEIIYEPFVYKYTIERCLKSNGCRYNARFMVKREIFDAPDFNLLALTSYLIIK